MLCMELNNFSISPKSPLSWVMGAHESSITRSMRDTSSLGAGYGFARFRKRVLPMYHDRDFRNLCQPDLDPTC